MKDLGTKKNRGFSLVEIMVAVGLLGAVSLGVSSLLKNMTKGNLKAQTDSDILLALNEITGILADPDNCKASFPTMSATPTRIKYKGTDKFIVNTPFGNTDSVISSYDIVYPAALPTEATLNIKFKKKSMIGTGDLNKKVSLYVELDASNNTIHCRAVSSAPDLWTRGSIPFADDIFFNGHVGIGTSSPTSTLTVSQLLNSTPNPSFGINIENPNSQATMLVRGLSDSGHTWAAIYLGAYDGTTAGSAPLDAHDSSWLIAHKADTPQDGFQIAHWYTPGGGAAKIMRSAIDIDKREQVAIGGGMAQARLHVVDRVDPSVAGGPPMNPFSSIIESQFGQGSLLLRGPSDSGLTYSALYLGDPTSTAAAGSWYVAHYNTQAPANGLAIGRNGFGAAISITSDTSKIGIGNPAPTAKLDVAGDLKVATTATISGNITGNSNLQVSGTITAGGTITSSSDRRLKKDIAPLQNSLEKILALRGVSFNWIEKHFGAGKQIGFIAQEIEKVFPELVRTDEKGFKSVAYQNLVAPLIEAVREQQTQIGSLQTELSESKLKIKKLEENQMELAKVMCESNPKLKMCH